MLFKGIRDGVKSKEVQNRAEHIVDVAERKMLRAKNDTRTVIEKLGRQKLMVYSEEIREFADIFSQIKNIEFNEVLRVDEYKNIGMNELNIKEMRSLSLTAAEALNGIATGLGAGVLVGWGTYGGVMALGTASTGAAISGLSGAAATNATLAWLGGGAIAAGGGGMALGSLVLGGLVAGPALLIAGGIIGAKGKESLNNAKSNLAAAKKLDSDVNVAVKELEIIREKAQQFLDIVGKLQLNAKAANKNLQMLVSNNGNWNTYEKFEKEQVFATFKTLQLLKKVVEIPLLTEDGLLTAEAKNMEQYIEGIY